MVGAVVAGSSLHVWHCCVTSALAMVSLGALSVVHRHCHHYTTSTILHLGSLTFAHAMIMVLITGLIRVWLGSAAAAAL
jgi:hypothetical protein